MELQHSFSFPLHANPCRLDPCINLHFIAIPVSKNTIGIWKTSDAFSERKSSPLPVELAGHNNEILALAFSNVSKHCLASSCREKILLWDLSSFEDSPKHFLFFSSPGDINVMCFNNSDSLIAAGKDYAIILLERGKTIPKALLESHRSLISCIRFCPHYSATLVSISDDRTFCVWDVEKLNLLYQSSLLSSVPLISVDMNLYEPHVAIGSADGKLMIFDLTDGHNFRQLFNLDVAGVMKKNQDKNKHNVENIENKKVTPTVVNKKGKLLQMNVGSGPSNNFVEASESLLHVEYTYAHRSHSDSHLHALPNVKGQFSGAGDLIRDISPGLSVISTNYFIQLNSKTLEIKGISNSQQPVKSASFASMIVAGPFSYAASKQISPFQNVVVAGTLFDRKIHVLTWTMFNEDCGNLQSPVCEEEIERTDQCASVSKEVLSVVAINDILENSPLKSEMLPPIVKGVITKGDIATGKKRTTSAMNQPLTFKSKVKSSDYSQAPRTSMFKPETSKYKLLNMDDPSKKKTSKVSSGTMKMLKTEYDQTKGPVNEVCNIFEVDSSATAVLALRFSDDGSNLACALSNKTALAIRSPFSKHICSSFIGHNNQVNSVYWSNSNDYLLTSSNDKTVVLWDKSGSEALMKLSHQKGTVKEKVDKQNSASCSLNPKAKSVSSGSDSSLTDNKPFSKEIKHVQFFYVDKFILITHSNELSLFKYYVSPEVDDLKRYQSRNRYKLVEKWQSESSSFTSTAAVNTFYSYLVLSTTSGKTIEVYDLNKSTRSCVFPDCHSRPPHGVVINEGSSFSSQSSMAYNIIATAAPTDPIKLWDLRSKSCVQALSGHLNTSHVCQLAFSPCGNYLASGSEDRCTYLFDLRKGTFCEKLRGHSEVVCGVAFHPAYPLLASSSLDSKVIWYKPK